MAVANLPDAVLSAEGPCRHPGAAIDKKMSSALELLMKSENCQERPMLESVSQHLEGLREPGTSSGEHFPACSVTGGALWFSPTLPIFSPSLVVCVLHPIPPVG